MIRWSAVIVLVAIVVAGCHGDSIRPTSPSPASRHPSLQSISGVVRAICSGDRFATPGSKSPKGRPQTSRRSAMHRDSF